MRKTLASIAVATSLAIIIPVAVFADANNCNWPKNADQAKVQNGTATCSANEDSTASANGPDTNATAAGYSWARANEGYATANAFSSSRAQAKRGVNSSEKSIASADFDSFAYAIDGGLAKAENGSSAEAYGQDSIAYATTGSGAVALNGGCAESRRGNSIVADGVVIVDSPFAPRFCTGT